ncbi:hypothetical protein ACOTWR_06325 [Aliarcobacter butzleri]
MSYEESLNKLRKITSDLAKEESEVTIENEKSENEINEIKKSMQEKISKIMTTRKKKLKAKESRINELQNEKMKIVGSIFMMFSQGKITKEQLDKVSDIEEEISNNVAVNDTNNKQENKSQTSSLEDSKATQKDN